MTDTAPNADHPPRGWLHALLRLWLLRPVPHPTGRPWIAILVMGVAWLAAWVQIDRWQSQPDPRFYPDDIPLFAWYVLAILMLAALLQWRARGTRFGAVLALALGVVPVPLLFTGVAAAYLDPTGFAVAAGLIGLYLLLYLARGLHAVSGTTQRAAACAGIVFIAGFCWLSDALDVIPDVWTPLETRTAQAPEEAPPADGEAVLFSQAARIDRALAAVGRAPSPDVQGFFVGFAGVGEQRVFAQEIGLASRVLGRRYGTGERRVLLINDQRDLEGAPLATVTGLKYALHGLAARMDPGRDVLFLSISSHGTEDPAIAVSNSELPLQDLTPEDLADALRESGIQWRVIIISACYAGGFIDSLKDPQTIVIAAAAADRSSFGCANDRDLTYFGEAFYRDALPGARSLREAFDTAKAAITAREGREHITASNPQAYFGKAMEQKLASMRAEFAL